MQDLANEYVIGLITYTELVEEMSQCDHEDAQIIAEEIDKVKQSDEYYDLQREFARKLDVLYERHSNINDIARYYIRKVYHDNK